MNGLINIAYILFWGIISFISSFSFVLEQEWNKIFSGDLLKDIYSPIFIWIIAFFGDYLYTLSSLNKETQILDSRWTLVSYIAIICIFINFLIGIYWECDLGRCVSMVGLFICMLGLKAASLYVLCPRQRVITV